jgi:ribosome recycling factor
MLDDLYAEFTEQMEGAIKAFSKELSKLRTGRAHASMLDSIKVDYYGTPTALSQVATIAVPEARVITIKPWEKPLLKAIEKAILTSDLGINPNNNGDQILLTIPALTQERRLSLVKVAKKTLEDIKISLRSHRHDVLKSLKELEDEKEISEDDHKKAKVKVQDIINLYSKKAEDVLALKEAEIMKV